jgi:hypothetical protein
MFRAYMSKSGVYICFTRALVAGMYGLSTAAVSAGVTHVGMAPTVAQASVPK